jgi:NADH-quinone oxidoreductase subunit J
MNTGILFYLIAGLTVASAIAAMTLRNLVHGVLCLVVTFAGLAALYLQLGAQFVGLAQILVYVGAVAILIVFAILLTRSDEKLAGTPIFSASWWVGLVIGLAVFACLAAAIKSSALASPARVVPVRPVVRAGGAPAPTVTPAAPVVTVKSIGLKLLGQSENYVLPLEVLGLLLTAAMLGAAVLAMPENRRKPE